MAIRPGTKYPAQTVSGDDNYPYGKARNEITPGDHTGSPVEATWVNDVWGFQQAMLQEAGVVPSDTPDNANTSQYLEALKAIVATQLAALRPTRYSIPLSFTYSLSDRFEYVDDFTTPVIRQNSVAGGGQIFIPFSLPFPGMRVTGVSLRVDGASGHAALPAAMPTFSCWRSNKHALLADLEIASGPDESSTLGTYEDDHLVSLTMTDPFYYDIGATDLFHLEIRGEAGTNAVVGLRITGATVSLAVIP